MLLSAPTWLIHLLTVTEWLTAMLLFHRCGTLVGRSALRLLAYAMVPHLFAGLCVLRFHVGGDSETAWLDAARYLTFTGSVALATATLHILLAIGGRDRRRNWLLPALVALLGLGWALVLALGAETPSAAILRAANLGYLLFLGNLLLIHRRDPQLLPPLSIAGFWLLLLFVAITITTTHIAVHRQGLPSLSHDDLLHGLSEAVLTVANSLVALGVYLRIRHHRRLAETASS